MPAWTCPDCSRRFGAVGRGHVCRPGTTLDELTERSVPSFRPIVDRLIEHFESLPPTDAGELIIDPLDKLVQFKHRAVFAMVRPMTKWTAVSFSVRRAVRSDRFSRKIIEHAGGFHHVLNLTDVAEIDDELLDWLTEAYDPRLVERPAEPSPGDPMVPDDIDLW